MNKLREIRLHFLGNNANFRSVTFIIDHLEGNTANGAQALHRMIETHEMLGLITMGLTALLNVSIERVAYRPLRHAPKLAPLITAVGFSFILQNVGLLWKGPANIGFPDVIPNTNILTTVLGLDTSVAITSTPRTCSSDPVA